MNKPDSTLAFESIRERHINIAFLLGGMELNLAQAAAMHRAASELHKEMSRIGGGFSFTSVEFQAAGAAMGFRTKDVKQVVTPE